MTTLDHSRTVEIEAPIGHVWATLADLSQVSEWIPGVKTSKVTSSQTDGLHSTRVCTLSPMGTISEEVSVWEPNKRLVIDIVDFKAMPGMRASTVEFDLAAVSDTRTTVTFSMGYTVGLGAVGAAMDKMMLKSQMTSGLEGMAAGLKKHIETGETINPKSKIPVDAVSVSS